MLSATPSVPSLVSVAVTWARHGFVGEPWWVGIDVTNMLGIVGGHQALRRLEDYERGVCNIYTPSGEQEMIIINESGMYSLLLTSRKPIAKQFKRWLTTEVLPSIRKHHQYPPPAIVDPATLPVPDSIQGDDLSSPAGRLIAELRRVSGVQDLRELALRFQGVISKNRFAQLKAGGGAMAALTHDDAWVALNGAGVDLSYVVNGIWLFTPDERALHHNLRTLDDREKAVAMHRIGGQIETLRLADGRG